MPQQQLDDETRAKVEPASSTQIKFAHGLKSQQKNKDRRGMIGAGGGKVKKVYANLTIFQVHDKPNQSALKKKPSAVPVPGTETTCEQSQAVEQ